jgi:hypothetical protein
MLIGRWMLTIARPDQPRVDRGVRLVSSPLDVRDRSQAADIIGCGGDFQTAIFETPILLTLLLPRLVAVFEISTRDKVLDRLLSTIQSTIFAAT